VDVSHNDIDGMVSPGETVQFSVRVSWEGPRALQVIAGGVHATPNMGTAANNIVPANLNNGDPNQVLNRGTASGGSVVDVFVLQGGLSWIGFGQVPPSPWGNNAGVEFLLFDWTAPQSFGDVHFDWIGSATYPDPVMVVLSGVTLQPVPTTYNGAWLTVVPSPSSVAPFAAMGCGLCGRRRVFSNR